MKSIVTTPALRPAALLAAGLALLFSGCALVGGSVPPAWENVQVSTVSSPSVEILPPRIRLVAGEPMLDGSLRRTYAAPTTLGQAVQVVGYDQAGHAVLQQTVAFAPAELRPRSNHPYNEGTYQLSLAHAPGGIVRLEVRIVADHPATS
ncbi:MAG TPA: hypothetical protein PLU52_03450 [Opitutaceae bacterium]|nr:hypothetical protein [Opitutaceae bacterium]HND61019.1 hypothetical protein [Opitutaceae bacterium]